MPYHKIRSVLNVAQRVLHDELKLRTNFHGKMIFVYTISIFCWPDIHIIQILLSVY